jgi:hypothetical protein
MAKFLYDPADIMEMRKAGDRKDPGILPCMSWKRDDDASLPANSGHKNSSPWEGARLC